jgi:hypothetical protein
MPRRDRTTPAPTRKRPGRNRGELDVRVGNAAPAKGLPLSQWIQRVFWPGLVSPLLVLAEPPDTSLLVDCVLGAAVVVGLFVVDF